MKSISIVRRNFSKKSNTSVFIFNLIFSLIGIIAIALNWKHGLCSVGIIAIIYYLFKYKNVQISILILIIIGMLIGCSIIFNLNFIQILLTTLSLSSLFTLKKSYEETKLEDDFEIFFLDKSILKCIATEHSDYKGYTLNPKAYIKTFETTNIDSFNFEGENLIIRIESDIVRPRELTKKDLHEIKCFVQENFSNLLGSEETLSEINQIENKKYLNILLISSPMFILPVFIYFFTDNGNDETLTILLLIAMFSLPFFIKFLINKKNPSN